MKKLILLALLLIVGCVNPLLAPDKDCAGVIGGTAEVDKCGVCNGDGSGCD